jgi:hypothetical protein
MPGRVLVRACLRCLSCLTFLVAACLVAAQAAPPDKLNEAAGPLPSPAAVQQALLRYLFTKDPSFDNRKPVKVISGPTLATGTTFAGNTEQAWLLCVAVNAPRTAPGPAGLQGKSLYLRSKPGAEPRVVAVDTWKDSTPQCGGAR